MEPPVGVPTVAGGKWYPATVGYMLRNGQYAGMAQWDGAEVDAAYPTIIDKATYEQAHRRLQGLRPGKQVEREIERRVEHLAA